MPDVRKPLIKLGADPVILAPDDFEMYMRRENEKWRNPAKDAKIPVVS